MDKIIALVSGLDSFCYLGQYLDKYDIEALTFNYGQRAQSGLLQTTRLLDSLRPDHPHLTCRTLLDISSLKFAYPGFQQTAEHSYPKPDYDSSVVLPFRNTIFLTIAMAYAEKVGAKRIIIGATIDDSSSFFGIPKFPDLNPKYLLNLEHILEMGCLPRGDLPVEIWSPARQGMSKAKNLKNGFEAFGEKVYETWSCFLENERQCGRCFGCTERRRVFKQAKIEDKTKYEE